MKKKKTFDMLNGSIWNKLILFALPLAASSILQQLFNAADVAVVGSFAGSGAAHTSILMSVIIGIVLLFVGFFFARPILELMSTPDDIINLAEVYLKIYFIGVPFVMLYNFAAAVLRSKGDTKRPLYCLIVLHMSVEGVAIGTVVSNIFSSMMLLYWLMHETDALRIDLKELKINGRILKRIAKIGVPAGLQGMVFSISNVCIQSSLNALGSDAIAASSAALNYEYFAYYILSSFAQAAVTFIGQNYSAKKYDRCKKITLQSFLLGGATTMVACMIFVIFDHFFISFFTSDASVASLAYTRMKIILPFQFLNMSIEVFSSVMRGVGYSSVPAGICVAGICGVRLAYLYTIYPSIASYDHLLIIYPISWFVTVLALALVYFIHVRPKVYHHQAAN